MCSNSMASAHFEVNQTKIKGDSQSGRKVVPHNSKSNLPLSWHTYCAESELTLHPLGHPMVPATLLAPPASFLHCTTSVADYFALLL